MLFSHLLPSESVSYEVMLEDGRAFMTIIRIKYNDSEPPPTAVPLNTKELLYSGLFSWVKYFANRQFLGIRRY